MAPTPPTPDSDDPARPADEELMRRMQGADPDALGVLYERYRKPLARFLLRLTGSGELAADLVHETVVRLYERRAQYHYPARVAPWLFRIARNLALDELRSPAHRRMQSLDAAVSSDAKMARPQRASFVALLTSGEPPQSESLLRQEMHEQLGQALASLPADQREAILLRIVQGMSYDDLAEVLEVNERTVRRRVARAIQSLSLFIKEG